MSLGAWTEAFGSAKYVSTGRHYGAKTISSAIDLILSKWGSELRPVAELMTAERYLNGDLARVTTPPALYGFNTQTLSDLISKTAYALSMCDVEQETAA